VPTQVLVILCDENDLSDIGFTTIRDVTGTVFHNIKRMFDLFRKNNVSNTVDGNLLFSFSFYIISSSFFSFPSNSFYVPI